MFLANRNKPIFGMRLSMWVGCWLNLLVTLPSFSQPTHGFRILPDPSRSVSGSPAYFVYEFPAGTAVEDAVLVKNLSDHPLRLALYPADVGTGAHGGIAIATRLAEEPTDAGAWIRLAISDLELKPNEARVVPFTIEIPLSLAEGEHAAALIAQRAEALGAAGANPFDIRLAPRLAVAVLVTISGPSPLVANLEITSLIVENNSRQQAVIAKLQNRSNDGLKQAVGNLTLHKVDGTTSREIPLHLGYFLAGSGLRYRIALEPRLGAGSYDATLSFTHQRGAVTRKERLFFSEPTTPRSRLAQAPPEPIPARFSEPSPSVTFMFAGVAGLVALLTALIGAWRLQRPQGRGWNAR